jgi:hypothetical protein
MRRWILVPLAVLLGLAPALAHLVEPTRKRAGGGAAPDAELEALPTEPALAEAERAAVAQEVDVTRRTAIVRARSVSRRPS